MPYNKKSSSKNVVPRGASAHQGRPKAGSRSPGHRGYRPADGEAPRKQRWTAEQRATRSGQGAGFGRDRGSDSEHDRRAGSGNARGHQAYRASDRGREEWSRNGSGADRGRGRPSGGRTYGERPYREQHADRSPARDRGSERGFDARRSATWDRESWNRDERGGNGRARGTRRDAESVRGERRDGAYARSDRPDNGRPDAGRGGRRWDRDGVRESDRRPGRSDQHDRADRRPDRDGARGQGGDLRGSGERRDSFDDRRDRAGSSRDRRGDQRDSFDDRRGRFDAQRGRFDDRRGRAAESQDRFGESQGRFGERRAGGDDRRGRSALPPRDAERGGRWQEADDVVLERLEATATLAGDVDGLAFGDLGLGNNIVRALQELGAESPFPIQAATIPDVLAGRDVLGRGRTGSGKTIAFAAPLVEKLMENGGGRKRSPGRAPRALILAPTRELALQIDRTVQPIARSVGLFTTQIYGGVPQHRQVVALQRGVDIVIGTPGRLEDLVAQGRLDLSEVMVTVLDEADHMCDLGFLEPVQRLLRLTADHGQRLLFSATLDTGVAKLVDEFLTEPAVHEVAGEDQSSSTIDHRVFVVEHREKAAVIEQLAARDGKVLIFSRTRSYAEQLSDQLEDAGIRSTSLHGDLNQSRRTRNLGLLTSGRVNVLVATDVAARGIHVDDIDLVIQADAPDEYKTYLHRAGRTGRAGRPGTVVTLTTRQRRRRLDDLLSRAEIDAEFVPVAPGDEILSAL